MKNLSKTKNLQMIFSFLISGIISSGISTIIKYYIDFLEDTAGSYNIAIISGMPLRDFLIKVLLLALGLLAFAGLFIRNKVTPSEKIALHWYVLPLSIFWIALPHISAYTVSRFTGTLLPQTISSIAIIVNVVFMMVSMLFAVASAAELLNSVVKLSEIEAKALCISSIICGIPFGLGITSLAVQLIEATLGLPYAFTFLGVFALIIGILLCICKPFNRK